MKPRYYVGLLLLLSIMARSQNVGIGTTTPTGPLSFSNQVGNKIVLWGDGNTNHYGIGVQSALLQLYTDLPASNIVFGHGRSGALTERVRILNSGGDGMFVRGRVHMLNGTSPINPAFGAGVWLYKPDNSGALGFMGVQNDKNLGFFGGPEGWGFVYDAINSRVGIGNPNPVAPLTFGAAHGPKIVLNSFLGGTTGLSTTPGKLLVHSEFGVSLCEFFEGETQEVFTFSNTGVISLRGNPGTPYYVLGTQGPNSGATWLNGLNSVYTRMQEFVQTTNFSSTNYGAIPGLTQQFFFQRGVRALISVTGTIASTACFACGSQRVGIGISINNQLPITVTAESSIPNGDVVNITTGMRIIELPAGTSTIIPVISNQLNDSRTYTASGFRMTIVPIPIY